jgi:zinc transporter 9
MTSQTPIMPKRMHVYDEREDCAKSSDNIRGLNATLGLVIHGAADGIALGASSLSGKGKLGLIVFIAVLVHKGECA